MGSVDARTTHNGRFGKLQKPLIDQLPPVVLVLKQDEGLAAIDDQAKQGTQRYLCDACQPGTCCEDKAKPIDCVDDASDARQACRKRPENDWLQGNVMDY